MADDSETHSPFDRRMVRTLHILQRDEANSNEPLTFDLIKDKIGTILESLRTCEDFTTEQVGHSLASIVLLPEICAAASTEPYEIQASKFRSQLSDFLSSHNYVKLFMLVARALEPHIMPEKFNEEAQSVFNFLAMCNGLLNYSDKSSKIADEFGNIGGVELAMKLIKILDNDMYEEDKSINNLHHSHLHILQAVMGILHNCTRHNSNNRHIYRKANAVEYFESKACSRHLNIRIGSVLILAQIADEKATERILPKLDCILLLVELLRRAVLSRHHFVNVIGEFDGSSRYSAQEITNALTRLAINDENKAAIQKCGGIHMLIYMLQNEFTSEESLEAFTLLWHLVFVDSVKRDDDIQELVEVFQILAISRVYFMRAIATYVLWEIRNHDMEFPSPPEDGSVEKPPFYLSIPATEDRKPKSGGIVISYQFESGSKALYIRDKLENAGYNVWMSEFPLRESILAEKIGAIRQAGVMLLGVSEKYKESPSCRSESTYAKEQGKIIIPLMMDSEYQPDGWIETLLGTDAKYHRFCTNEDMDRNIQGVMEELGDNGKTGAVKAIGHKLKSVMKKFRTSLDTSKSSSDTFLEACERNPRYWSSERVQTWLKDNGLEQVALPPELCQGNQLMHMYEHCTKAMHTFSEKLKSDFELDDTTVIKFTTALCQVCS